jgi:hypothetical protein
MDVLSSFHARRCLCGRGAGHGMKGLGTRHGEGSEQVGDPGGQVSISTSLGGGRGCGVGIAVGKIGDARSAGQARTRSCDEIAPLLSPKHDVHGRPTTSVDICPSRSTKALRGLYLVISQRSVAVRKSHRPAHDGAEVFPVYLATLCGP